MKSRLLIALVFSVAWVVLLRGGAQAQTLVYHWHFNNSTGSGGTLATPPAYADTANGYTGGTFVVAANPAAGLAAPVGSGLSNSWGSGPADLALVNPTAYRSA